MGRPSKTFGIPSTHKNMNRKKFVKRLDANAPGGSETTASSIEDRFAEGRIAAEIDGRRRDDPHVQH